MESLRDFLTILLITIVFNCSHLLYMAAMHIESSERNLSVDECNPNSYNLDPTARLLLDVSDPLLLCGPIMFFLIPVYLLSRYLVRLKLSLLLIVDPIRLVAGWLVSSVFYILMFTTPYYDWLSD